MQFSKDVCASARPRRGAAAHMAEADNQTHTEKLAADIANAILSGAFPPGSRLDEQTLAHRYNVSRTPVREALRQLTATGLIEIRPRRGAVVAMVSQTQFESFQQTKPA